MLHENAGPFATSAPPPPRMFLWQLLHVALPTHSGTRMYQTYDKKIIYLFRAHNLLALLVRVVQEIVCLPFPHIGGQQGGTVPGVAGVVGLQSNIIWYKYTIRSIDCEASCHPVTRSLGHSVTLSLYHLVTWSLGHLVTWSHPSHHVFTFSTSLQTDKWTNNIRVCRSALQTIKI